MSISTGKTFPREGSFRFLVILKPAARDSLLRNQEKRREEKHWIPCNAAALFFFEARTRERCTHESVDYKNYVKIVYTTPIG